jgi:L-fuconolactonase
MTARTSFESEIEARYTVTEPIIEPDLPIVDPHHHLWFLTDRFLTQLADTKSVVARAMTPTYRRRARYLHDELMADLTSGHNIRATVFVDAHAMYRVKGPEALRSMGEVEFVNGIAAMAASETFGDVKACAGIVGNVDLRLGDAVEEVLRAHLQAGGGRYRGVRCAEIMAYDEDFSLLGPYGGVPHLLLDSTFRAGFQWLHKLGLTFDAWLLEPQLPDLIDLARAFPQTQIILDHLGAPVGIARYAGQRETRFSIWRDNIRRLSSCHNVAVKLGGLGMPLAGFESFMSTPPRTSAQLAAEWKPYIETCIEAFGADRCMFESNFPVDAATCSYPVLWNTFKRLAAGASIDDKRALFSGTATRLYRLDL